jgi:hypothetical protein
MVAPAEDEHVVHPAAERLWERLEGHREGLVAVPSAWTGAVLSFRVQVSSAF